LFVVVVVVTVAVADAVVVVVIIIIGLNILDDGFRKIVSHGALAPCGVNYNQNVLIF